MNSPTAEEVHEALRWADTTPYDHIELKTKGDAEAHCVVLASYCRELWEALTQLRYDATRTYLRLPDSVETEAEMLLVTLDTVYHTLIKMPKEADDAK